MKKLILIGTLISSMSVFSANGDGGGGCRFDSHCGPNQVCQGGAGGNGTCVDANRTEGVTNSVNSGIRLKGNRLKANESIQGLQGSFNLQK